MQMHNLPGGALTASMATLNRALLILQGLCLLPFAVFGLGLMGVAVFAGEYPVILPLASFLAFWRIYVAVVGDGAGGGRALNPLWWVVGVAGVALAVLCGQDFGKPGLGIEFFFSLGNLFVPTFAHLAVTSLLGRAHRPKPRPRPQDIGILN